MIGYVAEQEVLTWWWRISFFLGVSTKVKYSTDEFKSAQKYELTGGLPHHLTLTCTLAAKEAMQKSESMAICIS